MVRPGHRLLIFSAGVAAPGLLAFIWGPILWFVVAAVIPVLLLAWWDARGAAAMLAQIRVSRTAPRVVGRDLEFRLRTVISNDGSRPLSGELRDVRPAACVPAWAPREFQLAAGASLEIDDDCRIPQRGLHTFGPMWIRVTGPWGLMEAQQEVACPAEVRVLPESFASREQLQKDLGAELLTLDRISRSRQTGAGTEFVALDFYRRGDDPRRVDWRATARHGYPIVRRYQVERHRDVLILIDSGRLMGALTDRGTKLDCAVDAALNLARVALHSGDRCGIGVFDSELRGYLPPIAGSKSLKSLVDCVYDLQTQWRETDFTQLFAELQRRQSKRTFIVILSDLADAETSRSHCLALSRLNRRHLVLFAALRTPLLQRTVHRAPATVLDGAQQTVAMGLLRDRRRSLHVLRHGGVHVLDVEPRQLTLPLINQFIELRQRNQL